MKNLSSLFKLQFCVVAALVTAVTEELFSYFFPKIFNETISTAFLGGLILFSVASIYFLFKTKKFVLGIGDVCEEVRKGNFEARIINMNEGRELGKLANSVNNAIDVCDAFVRESMLAMKAASEGRYYRKIRQEGMLGSFINAVNGINSAINMLANKDAADRKNKEMVDLTMTKIKEMVADAASGNLSNRIDVNQFEGGYKDLVAQMNGLMEAISAPLANAIDILNSFSKGDLTRKVEGQYGGTFAEIQNTLNSTIQQLSEMVAQIKEVAESVAIASSEISAGSTDLSKRTEQQAAAIEQTSASMSEMTKIVKGNTEKSKEVEVISTKAKQIAESGNVTAKNAVDAMRNIEQSSKKVSDITSAIDEIAFQTNLLALNAAVEAARAGEAGRGFAVVAEEVRTLAGRSAKAAKEIKTLIESSSEEVSKGSELVNNVGNIFDQITTSNGEVANNVENITKSSEEQSSGIGEINSAIADMDEAVQQNAALVQQNTAACQSLVEQAEQLSSLIQFFKTDMKNHPNRMPNQQKVATLPSNNNLSGGGNSNKKPITGSANPKPAAAAKPSIRVAASGSGTAQALARKPQESGWEEF